MRLIPTLAILLSVAFLSVHAQEPAESSFGNPKFKKENPTNTIFYQLAKAYRFPEFVKGKIVLRNREEVVARLNYHIASGQLQYINDKNDTLNFAYPETIAYAIINDSKFYFVKGKYLQTLETNAGLTLAYNQEITTLYSKTYVLYANSNQIREHTIDLSSLLDSDQEKLTFDADGFSGTTYIAKHYYFGDPYGNFVKANKNNLLKYFEKNAIPISKYIDKHATSFYKLSDIKEVLHYASALVK